MKGVSYITDEHNRKKAVVIELETIERYEEELTDLLDGILAESRKGEDRVSLAEVIDNLKKAGKLQ